MPSAREQQQSSWPTPEKSGSRKLTFYRLTGRELLVENQFLWLCYNPATVRLPFEVQKMTAQQLSVACMGLGRIGSGIAQSVQRAGHRLIVYNRTPEKARTFSTSGAVIAHSPREAAAQADVVLTCLMGDDSVLENLVGENGILAGLRSGAIHIGTSTVTPKATAQFAKMHRDHGSHYLAATFAGHPDHAAAGKLMTFVAGEPAVLERARPVLEAYTGKILVLGEKPALAASFKLVVNFFAACLLETMGEAFVFAEKQGLKLETVASMLKDVLQHPAMPRYIDKIHARNFSDSGIDSRRCRLERRPIHHGSGGGIWRSAAFRQHRSRQNHCRPSLWFGRTRLVRIH
jgi:3-hydroxyisobutyrate dehydrogenase-like beta-hydroxyacid dehydrogenase